MDGVAEAEQRLAAALGRIGQAAERLGPAGGVMTPRQDHSAEVRRLTEALRGERAANADLIEKVREVRRRQDAEIRELQERLAQVTAQLDALGLTMQQMRKVNINLREAARTLREAAAGNVADATLVNRTMAAELEALRVSRAAETAELDEILAELEPLIDEEAEDAGS